MASTALSVGMKKQILNVWGQMILEKLFNVTKGAFENCQVTSSHSNSSK